MYRFCAVSVVCLTLSVLVGCQPSIRKDAKDLSAEEKARFVDALLALKATPSPYDPELSYYDQFVQWHLEINNCLSYSYHGGPAFLPWHRAYLLEFERALSKVAGEPISVPYWNWTDEESTAAVFAADFMGGTGDPGQGFAVVDGPFQKGQWTVEVFDMDDPARFPYLTRNIGSFVMPHLPTGADVAAGLAISNYDQSPWNVLVDHKTSFRQYIEGWRDVQFMGCSVSGMMTMETNGTSQMHNRVHVWVGGALVHDMEGEKGHTMEGEVEGEDGGEMLFGTMAYMNSPADPVFWLHHAYVDYIWEQWMAIHGKQYLPQANGREFHNANDPLWPFTREVMGVDWTAAKLLDSWKIGVFYVPSSSNEATN